MIYILLATGFEEIEALATADILKRAGLDVRLVSADSTEIVSGAHNIKVVADIMLGDIKELGDAVILPGGLPGTTNLHKNMDVIDIVSRHYTCGKYVAAICAAPSILGDMRILENRKATCYPSYEDELIGAEATRDRVVVDGNVITSRAAGTSMEFAFKLIELLTDTKTADKVRGSMLYD